MKLDKNLTDGEFAAWRKSFIHRLERLKFSELNIYLEDVAREGQTIEIV